MDIQAIFNLLSEKNFDFVMELIQHIIRIITLTLFGTGVRYSMLKMFSLDITEKLTNTIVFIFILLGSLTITDVYFKTESMTILRYFWESIVFGMISVIGYVAIGKDICTRIDDFLDNKFGKN